MNYKTLISVFVLLASPIFTVQAQTKKNEAFYVQSWCDGVIEYRIPKQANSLGGARVDCLLPTQAIEFDWANKWAECIGQASYYGAMTRRPGVCMLIYKAKMKPSSWLRFVRRARVAGQVSGVKLRCLSANVVEIACPK